MKERKRKEKDAKAKAPAAKGKAAQAASTKQAEFVKVPKSRKNLPGAKRANAR
jgi:hypothetical protein